jgi:hypothetical protein
MFQRKLLHPSTRQKNYTLKMGAAGHSKTSEPTYEATIQAHSMRR